MSEGRILFIDAYDSFSNNIIALLKSELSVSVDSIKIDDSRFVLNDDAFHELLAGYDAVVAGPGPGHPGTPSDVGSIGKLWRLPDECLIPVLGICLAFQSMALAFGGAVERLREPRHGMVTPVLHCDKDVFEDTGEIVATQYHSLHVKLGDISKCSSLKDLWRPSRLCKELVPLAWDLSDEGNGLVLMGVRHRHKPFWGVQYHPESICTNEAGQQLITSWWSQARTWNSARGHGSNPESKHHSSKHAWPRKLGRASQTASESTVHWQSLHVPDEISIPDIVSIFRRDGGQDEPILLESGLRNGRPVNAETGSQSIIGLPDDDAIHIKYSVADRELVVSTVTSTLARWKATVSDAFAFLDSFVETHRAAGGSANVPFWGGLIGFVSYEAGLESIDVEPKAARSNRPDLWFVFIQRSIALDHNTGSVYVQSIREHDIDWIVSTRERLRKLQKVDKYDPSDAVHDGYAPATIYTPKEKKYSSNVQICQDHLRAGSSYELCLTDTTLLRNDEDPWQMYMRLRELNPAPFSAYFTVCTADSAFSNAQNLHLLSSSPERFLSWSRDGKCQFRPIKGTVKKVVGMTRQKAEHILNSPKERAENLMIVDLIRHDLNGVACQSSVQVPKLMSVEEYESVFQLVSVIEGDFDGSGVPVLATSLPPGSMTGAPKKRTCELLQDIEGGKARGLYSGVFGYLDVGGGGDFSVVIRSAFKWNDEEWRIGAGGAVTALSDPKAEWEEMLAKRENVLRAFS